MGAIRPNGREISLIGGAEGPREDLTSTAETGDELRSSCAKVLPLPQ